MVNTMLWTVSVGRSRQKGWCNWWLLRLPQLFLRHHILWDMILHCWMGGLRCSEEMWCLWTIGNHSPSDTVSYFRKPDPKVHAMLVGHREASLSSVWSPDYLASVVSGFDTHQSWQHIQFSSRMECFLITASLLLMHQMKCSLCIGLGGETQPFALQNHFLLTP